MNERIIKALNDLKSDLGFVKKHILNQESAKHTEAQTENTTKFVRRNLENAQPNTKGTRFAGVARQTRVVSEPLVERVITTQDSSDSEGEQAFMTTRVVWQISNRYKQLQTHDSL